MILYIYIHILRSSYIPINVGPSYAWGPGLMSSSGANSGSVGMFRDPL